MERVIRILAEKRTKTAVITVERLPFDIDAPGRYAVKSVEIKYFTGEQAVLDYCRKKYRLSWTPSGSL